MLLPVREFCDSSKASLCLAGWLCYWNLLHLFLDKMFNGECQVTSCLNACHSYPFTYST